MPILKFRDEVQFAIGALKPHAINLTRDIHDAEDLIQDTIVRALSNEDKFEEGTNIRAWLFTIMKNLFINNYRKKIKRNTVIDTTDNLYFLNSAQTFSNAGERSFVMDDIRNALVKISSELRVPFLMHYKGYKYQEIAEKLQLPLGTVKSRIFFARKELMKILKADYR